MLGRIDKSFAYNTGTEAMKWLKKIGVSQDTVMDTLVENDSNMSSTRPMCSLVSTIWQKIWFVRLGLVICIYGVYSRMTHEEIPVTSYPFVLLGE